MARRIRHALGDSPYAVKLGGENKVVEIDEPYIGGKDPLGGHVRIASGPSLRPLRGTTPPA